jgi:NifB/MoaA-like Fe-S oxidoreductase
VKEKMTESYYPYLLQAVSAHNVLPLTSACNLRCVFCSHRQNPPGINTYRLPPLPLDTIEELATFLSPGQKVIIGESATRLDEGEPLTHPKFPAVLTSLRQALPDTLIAVTTNGSLLTENMVDQLAGLMPIELTVSLNSASPRGRLLLMGDTEPERAILAVESLHAAGISFHGSIVAMPHLVGEDDIVETARFLAQNGALTVRVFLPGYTKYAPAELRFPAQSWPALTELAHKLTAELDMPVIPEPAFPPDFTPLVYGVMPGTPAHHAGVAAHDEIAAVNGKRPRSRVDAFSLARQAPNPYLHLQRNGSQYEVILKKARGEAPGFVVNFDFDPARLDEIGRVLAHNRSKSPLILCSQFGETIMQNVASELGLAKESVLPVPNIFFGGSIKSAGLLVVEDILAAARPALTGKSFDLALVPREAFDHTNCDLTGRSLHELQQELHLPVHPT